MKKQDVSIAAKKTYSTIKVAIVIMAGVLMFISFFNPFLEKYYPQIFTGNFLIDPIIGAIAGSIAFGIPITAYITGGELLKAGVSLLAVTAFILAWTTVGVAILPLEIKFLGKKFALWRNGVTFVLSIIIAILTYFVLGVIG